MDTNLVKCSSNTSISIIVNIHYVGLFYNNQRSGFFHEPNTSENFKFIIIDFFRNARFSMVESGPRSYLLPEKNYCG